MQLGAAPMVACMLDAEPELVNMRGPGGVSPLHLAPTREIAAMLVQRGGDIEADYVSHARQTPLHSAAVEGRQEVVEYLLDQGEAAVGRGCVIRGHLPK